MINSIVHLLFIGFSLWGFQTPRTWSSVSCLTHLTLITLILSTSNQNGRMEDIHPTLQVLISGYHHWYPGTCTNPLPVFVLLYKALKSKYAGAADNVIQSVHFYIYQSQSGTVSNTPIKPTSSIYSNNCSFIKPRLYDGGTRRGSHYKIFLATHSIPVNFQYERGISQSPRQAGAGLRIDCWCLGNIS